MAKLLLVEDDNNLREIYEARLSAEGYEITTAQNGEEALSLAKQNHPDLIISDVMMPRISGFEMLDILRNTDELKNTKVIMLTALGQADDRGRADNLGADKYLVKSQVTLEDIVNATKALLSGDVTSASADKVTTEAPVHQPEPAAPIAQPSETASSSTMPEPTTSIPATMQTPDIFTQATEPVTHTPEIASDVTTQSVVDGPVESSTIEDKASIAPPVQPLSYSAPTSPSAKIITSDQPSINSQTASTDDSQSDAYQASTSVTTDQTTQDDSSQIATDTFQPTTVSVPDPDPITPHISPVAEQIDYSAVAPSTPTSETTASQPTSSFATEPTAGSNPSTPEASMPEPTAADSTFGTPTETAPSTESQPMVAGPQSIADEEAAIEAQIAAFAQTTEAPTSEEPMPTAVVDTPEPAPVTPQAANDAILSNAIAQLTTPSDAENNDAETNTPTAQPDPSTPVIITPKPDTETETESKTPEVPTENDALRKESDLQEPTSTAEQPDQAPTDASSAAGQQSISGHKIIQPLSRPEEITPKLDKLLALEEAKEATDQLPTPTVGTTNTPAQPTNKPGIDPNSIAL